MPALFGAAAVAVALGSLPLAGAAAFDSVEDFTRQQHCDILSTGAICANGGSTVLLPNSVSHALIGHWTFDEEAPIDASGTGNHGSGELFHSTSPVGSGSSALFERNFLTVPHSKSFEVPDFSYSFWVFIPDEAQVDAHEAPRWCPLLRKGVYIAAAEEFSNAPALMFSRTTRRMRAVITTTMSGLSDGEHVDSNARLLPNRWAHVAIVHHGPGTNGGASRLLLYINGILDARLLAKGSLEPNQYPLYVGGDPFTADDCGFTVYVDELRAYARALMPHELQAEAAPALAGADPAFVHLGCTSCTLETAMMSCPKDRHICSSLELHVGGYQVARAIGWLTGGMHVWTSAAVRKHKQLPDPKVEYVRCADEGAVCPCSGEVSYGDGNNWTAWVRVDGGSIMCNSTFFDGDPAPAVEKHCACRQAAPRSYADPAVGLALCCEGEMP
mmetsp:Transcript_40843/g.81193  ORF Transcript_40843/g.81193 Transcript_40843/m.81193 type:complete len:443 (-) Transcript_40843:118-1446(-)